MTDNAELADLKRELADLKASLVQTQTPSDPAAMGRWRDEMHALSEARMSRAANFSPEDLRAMEAACPTTAVKDIAAKGTVQPPSMAGACGQVTSVQRSPGLHGTTGWAPQVPFTRNDLHPTPGVAAADRLMDQADIEDRVELAKRIAEQRVAQAAASKTK